MYRFKKPARTWLQEDRRKMVESLRQRGIHDRRVLEAMLAVPREEFVSAAQEEVAYDDCPLPIGLGQTISQPYTVAFMCQEALPKPDDRALEIGSGSGYGAAVLSHLTRRVDTVERIPELATRAESALARQGYSNVAVHRANGTLGLPAFAPFDIIIVTAGAPRLPPALVGQLAVGGRIIIPIGVEAQSMFRFIKLPSGDLDCTDLGAFRFVPLVGEDAWLPMEAGIQSRPPS